MRTRRISPTLATLPALLALGGCGYVHVGRAPEPVTITTVIGDEKLLKQNADLRVEKKMLQQELALTRAQGDALRTAIENRAADGDTSRRLVERLAETSRELATLRASHARLQTERSQALASTNDAAALEARLGEAEEKLAASLRGYTDLQQEIGRLRNEVARTRAENVALSEQVKTVTAHNEHAQAALAQLNTDLLAQKDARFRAEQDAATLRNELQTFAPDASVLAQQRTAAAADARSLAAEHAAETAALKEQLDALRTRVEALAAERAALTQQIADAQGGQSAATADLTKALRSAAMLRDENAELRASGAKLADQLVQAKAGTAGADQVQSLREQLREAQSVATSLTEENARLRGQLPQPDATERSQPGGVASSNGAGLGVPSAGGSGSGGAPTPVVSGVKIHPGGVSATLVTSRAGARRGVIVRHDASGSNRVHVVAGGDTLARISKQYYGTPGRWGEILSANRDILGENNNLVIGRMLRIP